MCSKLGDPLATEPAKSPLDIVHDHPEPNLRDRDVRIQIVAASLNFADVLQVQVKTSSNWCSGDLGPSSMHNMNPTDTGLRRANIRTSHPFPSSPALKCPELSPKLAAKCAA